jgi:hypothetical protein
MGFFPATPLGYHVFNLSETGIVISLLATDPDFFQGYRWKKHPLLFAGEPSTHSGQ